MKNSIKYTRVTACAIAAQSHPGFDRQKESDHFANGGFRPEPTAGPPVYGVDELGPLDYQLTLRETGFPIKLAGAYASRLHRAITAHPDADRLALVTMENGNRFAVPAENIDLSSGYSSGGAVRETLIVDVRNLRARVARMIEAAAQIVGDPDGE